MRLHYLFEVTHAFASITRAYVMQSDGVSCKRQLEFRPLGPVVNFRQAERNLQEPEGWRRPVYLVPPKGNAAGRSSASSAALPSVVAMEERRVRYQARTVHVFFFFCARRFDK